MSVVGYATPGKQKARTILDAFCAGAGGKVVDGSAKELLPGAVAFYGVTAATKHLLDQAKAEGRDFYYIDNAYFDRWRGIYFRVTKNRLQHLGTGCSDGTRFKALEIDVMPWRRCGRHICVVPQSDEFMRVCAGYGDGWLDDVLAELYVGTVREIRVLAWDRNKADWYRRLPPNLAECHALVTYSSASAISAMLAGVPAICTATDCISAPLAGVGLERIEDPPCPEGREEWAHVVADNQWRLDEFRDGTAWHALTQRTSTETAA